jgi:hypothetical protein
MRTANGRRTRQLDGGLGRGGVASIPAQAQLPIEQQPGLRRQGYGRFPWPLASWTPRRSEIEPTGSYELSLKYGKLSKQLLLYQQLRYHAK